MQAHARLSAQVTALPLLCLALVASAIAQPVPARAPLDADRDVLSYADLIEPVLPGVVSVHAVGVEAPAKKLNDPFLDKYFSRENAPREKPQTGAGFVIDAAGGLIVTASFLLDDVKSVSVKFPNGVSRDATVVAVDKESEIALLRIRPEGLTALTWGDSRSTRVGDVVFAIGHPYGLGRSVTAGIVSGFSQGDERLNYRDMIMTDATIARGYAGGPLIDSKGRVVGVAVAIFTSGSDLQLSFAVPAAVAQRVVKDLLAFGRVKRASLGVQVAENVVDEDFEDGVQVNPDGIVITQIVQGSSAERVGLKAGDVILRAAGKPMQNPEALRAVVQIAEVGAPIEIVYRRSGAQHTVTVPLGEAQP